MIIPDTSFNHIHDPYTGRCANLLEPGLNCTELILQKCGEIFVQSLTRDFSEEVVEVTEIERLNLIKPVMAGYNQHHSAIM